MTITRADYELLMAEVAKFRFSTFNRIGYGECQHAKVLVADDDLILVQDQSQNPPMNYFATNDVKTMTDLLADMANIINSVERT